MIRGNIKFNDKFIALILSITNNNCKIRFCFLLLMSLYIQILYI